ncbi:diguanylate cyclase [Sphingomonas sp.]|uniref:GGDEF domain-containing protein n=1 Tax=Sphingomonas sp. TaxID=28214 RepID=UPI003B3B62F8
MMDTALFVRVALVSTTMTMALVMALAWRDFDRPRHIAMWAGAFGLATIIWLIGLIVLARPSWDWLRTVMFAVMGFASLLNTMGFRARSGSTRHDRWMIPAAAGHAAVQIALVLAGAGLAEMLIPLNLFNAVMLWLAARPLRGRRRGERVAERVAEGGLLLLSVASAAAALLLLGVVVEHVTMDARVVVESAMLVMPAALVGIGLFAIILLAADLADRARRLAATDMLTGLLNRRGFEERGRALFESARAQERTLVLVLMDLDRFKLVNDRFGHPAGDRLLCQVAQALMPGADRRAIVARMGGEEFAMMLADTDPVRACRAMEELRLRIAGLTPDLPDAHRVTASFGLAALREEDRDLHTLLGRADAALYRSKAEGRNRLTLA